MQSPVSIGGPTIEDAAHLLRSVAHPLLASLSSHQAGLDSASDASPEAKQAQQAQQAAQPNGNGHHAVAHSPPYGGSDEAVDADQLQIQVNQKSCALFDGTLSSVHVRQQDGVQHCFWPTESRAERLEGTGGCSVSIEQNGACFAQQCKGLELKGLKAQKAAVLVLSEH